MKQIDEITEYALFLRLYHLKNKAPDFIHSAQIDKPSYIEFIHSLLKTEVEHRQRNDLERRLKLGNLPLEHNLGNYDYNRINGVTKAQLKQLRELLWVEQNYNLILMGPSGTGKTYIASGLINDAIRNGYKACFTTMAELVSVLKMKELTSKALGKYNRLIKAHVLAIDDIMLFPLKKEDSVAFFNLINALHEKASVIITTNKSPTQWAETLDDEVLATALLDRLLFRCEVIKLEGESYRMENRKSIFNKGK